MVLNPRFRGGGRFRNFRDLRLAKVAFATSADFVVAGLLLDKDKKGRQLSSLIIGANGGKKNNYIGLVEAGLTRKDFDRIFSEGKKQPRLNLVRSQTI